MDKIFLDTNVLVSAIDITRKNHKKAIQLIKEIKTKGFQTFISTRCIIKARVYMYKVRGGIRLICRSATRKNVGCFSSRRRST